MPRFSNMYDPEGSRRPQPAPVPAGPPAEAEDAPITWHSPGQRQYAFDRWKFLRWQVARERRNWPDRVQAPLEISPDARYVD